MTKRTEQYDVVIVGGGPAGLTAAIYCGRARLKTLLIEKSLIGGLATYTDEIENFPGFPDGATGHELMDLFYKQAKNFNVKFKFTDVKSVEVVGDKKIVETFRTNYEAKVVIVASGGKPRLTGAKNENKFLYDKGISFCATCDAAANTDKTVMVVGSGDAAIEEGMFLTKFAKEVIVSVMHDPGIMDCNEIAKVEALNNPKMSFIWNTIVDSFEGDEHLSTVVLKNTKTNELIPVEVDTGFLFIGYIPNTDIFKGMLDMTGAGYLITNEKMETNIPGIFAAGDVRDSFLKQVATAVGDGAIAGYGAEKYIAESEIYENQILNEGEPSLVYLWNAVDPSSRELLPVIEAFEIKHGKTVRVTKVDSYKSKGIAERLNIKAFPTVVFINEGKVVQTLSDEISEEKLEELIKL
ncbi:MAG: FAD-dependent oxidoreductase [Epulopiscium sp.]|nr:FAD-dependent oxidoreductase [Candidatus Epulonipiscium sp.]